MHSDTHDIRARRKALGLTQAQLAEQAGCARQTLAYYERGVTRQYGPIFDRINAALDAARVKDQERRQERYVLETPTAKVERALSDRRADMALNRLLSELIARGWTPPPGWEMSA
jgi:transcriptional regulator with XRE-family HTH domain